jgi:hypothetical protein
MSELLGAMKVYKHDTYVGLRKELREIARPTEKLAEGRTVATFSNIGDKWWNMRIGVSRNLVYIAPMQRSRYTRLNPGRYARPGFGARLDREVMTPVQRAFEQPTMRAVERMIDRAGERWGD